MLSTCDEAQRLSGTVGAQTRSRVPGPSGTADALTEVLDRIVASTAALDDMLERLRVAAAVRQASRIFGATDVSGFVGGAIYEY